MQLCYRMCCQGYKLTAAGSGRGTRDAPEEGTSGQLVCTSAEVHFEGGHWGPGGGGGHALKYIASNFDSNYILYITCYTTE